MTQDKAYKDKNLDVLTALKIGEQALNGPPTDRRLLIVRLSLAATLTSTDNYFNIKNRLDHITTLVNLSKQLQYFCDPSFLYWHQMLIHVYFQTVFDAKTDLGKVLVRTKQTLYSSPKISVSSSYFLCRQYSYKINF